MTESRYEYLGQRTHQPLVGRESSSEWEMDVTHRKMILRILPGDPESGRRGTLCVLGAGRCRELKLEALLRRYHELHLVDCDGEAVKAGVEEQNLKGHPRVMRHAGVDIGGANTLVDEFANHRGEAVLDQIETVLKTKETLIGLGRFEVVLSSDVLPEMLARLVESVGKAELRLPVLIGMARKRHVSDMLDLTTPGGQAILVTEVTNSEWVSQLRSAPGDLSMLLREVQEKGLFHAGCNPAVIDSMLTRDRELADRIARYDISPPWLRPRRDGAGLYLAYRLTCQ